jgi:Tn3 transposase DDE domain
LERLQSVDLRRRVQVGFNKGEAKNALARAVFFNRLGELRDRSFEHQYYRASGLNLVVAAIILWNTVYLERTVNALKAQAGARRASAATSLAAGLGAHQLDRPLYLAAEQRVGEKRLPPVALGLGSIVL